VAGVKGTNPNSIKKGAQQIKIIQMVEKNHISLTKLAKVVSVEEGEGE